MMKIFVWGYEHKAVDEAVRKIIQIAKSYGSKVRGPIPLPTKKIIFTVLRGVTRHKDSREQFERRTHKRLIVVFPNLKTIDQLKKLTLASSVNLSIKTI